MKRRVSTALTFVVLSLPTTFQAFVLGAQVSTQPHARSPEQVVEMYDARLSLTPDQKQKLKLIVAERQEKMQKLKSDTGMRQRDKAIRMKETMQSSDTRINAVLNADQRKKYAAMEDEMMRHQRDGAKKTD